MASIPCQAKTENQAPHFLQTRLFAIPAWVLRLPRETDFTLLHYRHLCLLYLLFDAFTLITSLAAFDRRSAPLMACWTQPTVDVEILFPDPFTAESAHAVRIPEIPAEIRLNAQAGICLSH